MLRTRKRRSVGVFTIAMCFSLLGTFSTRGFAGTLPSDQEYVVIGWNDLGMHCMSPDFSAICVLPPYNNLWSQVVRRGNPPQLVSSNVALTYRFPQNSTSADKVNFWTYAPSLFGVTLAPNVGLAGNGMTGSVPWSIEKGAYEAVGVPLTPFEDAAPTVEQPYQFAEVTLRQDPGGQLLDQTTFVAPVSVEMHCDKCHKVQGEPVWDTILKQHEGEGGVGNNLINEKPVLCARCHASNALGAAGIPDVPNLSYALHNRHAAEAPDITCYDCHPGQQTKCLRGAMYLAGKTCTDCHGSLSQVASSIQQGRRPWLDEPGCAQTGCHPAKYAPNPGKLYRNSTGHGGLYCIACHNSPHAELPTSQPRDGVQAIRLQGKATYLKTCTICHTQTPAGPGPHGYHPRASVEKETWRKLR